MQKCIRKLTDYFFTIIYEETESMKKNLFTALKENAALIRHFETMYINFNEHLPYSGVMSELF